jgi:S1-C subfamily serine protease
MYDSIRSDGTRPVPSNKQPVQRLLWFLTALIVLLLLRFVVPYFAEQIQYSVTRGKQRAEYETAGKALELVKLNDLSKAYQLVSQRVAPSVVNINIASVVEVRQSDELTSLFGPRFREALGQGSGVIVDSAGYILTNNHVVANATEIQVVLADGRMVDARVVGLDPLTDIAVLKVNADKLIPAEWGDSEQIQVGALVWAVGSPFGLQHSITSGILSGKNRQGVAGSVYHDFLQTDAAVNPGNSGGPLVDAHGRIVGINTAIVGEAYLGISFAIPANEARAVYERLRSEGYVARGWLGVGLEDMNGNGGGILKTPTRRGVLVTQVFRNSPADKAGIRVGDVILQWDGHNVDSKTMLSRLVARTKVGSSVEVVIQQGQQKMTLSVTVGERPTLAK